MSYRYIDKEKMTIMGVALKTDPVFKVFGIL